MIGILRTKRSLESFIRLEPLRFAATVRSAVLDMQGAEQVMLLVALLNLDSLAAATASANQPGAEPRSTTSVFGCRKRSLRGLPLLAFPPPPWAAYALSGSNQKLVGADPWEAGLDEPPPAPECPGVVLLLGTALPPEPEGLDAGALLGLAPPPGLLPPDPPAPAPPGLAPPAFPFPPALPPPLPPPFPGKLNAAIFRYS